MQTEEIPYGTYLDGRFSQVRDFQAVGPWEIVTATEGDRPIVLIVDEQARRVTLRRYDNEYEYMFDLMRLSQTPPDDGDAAGIWSRPPTPPPLSAGAERGWPRPWDEPDDTGRQSDPLG